MSVDSILAALAALAVFAVLLAALWLMKRRGVGFTPRVFTALGLGIALGVGMQLALGRGSDAASTALDWMAVVGQGYIALLKMLVMPLVFVAIVGAFTNALATENLGRISAVVLAVLLGLEAMRVFRVYCCVHWPRPAVWAGGGTVLLLCGFGMYIGRFLRLNSWDILHPLALLRRVWASMDTFQLQVTLLFTGAVFLLWLAYGALRPVDGEKQENKESDALST